MLWTCQRTSRVRSRLRDWVAIPLLEFSWILLIVWAAMLLSRPAWGQESSPAVIDIALAKQYFGEMRSVSDQDTGRLWGVRLYGPMMFADTETRQVVASQADKEGQLQPKEGVFVGQMPPEIPLANTGTDWAGVRWTMIIWPPPENRRSRKQLMVHESFHRVQPQLGLEPKDGTNNHLDGRIGRTWLQLEWHALTRALATRAEARREAITDALYFRGIRRKLIPNAAANENGLEINEGIAEYTGVKLSARYPLEADLVAEMGLWEGPNRSPFVRSFAYVSGPAYGMLLDSSGMNWRKQLKSDSDLGVMLARAYHLPTVTPTQAEAIARARKYDGDEIIEHEKKRELRQQKVITEHRTRFIERPVLVLPLGPKVHYGFNPNRVTAIDDNTAVYEGQVQVTDDWGTVSATGGVLLVRENGKLKRGQVPAPAKASGSSIAGEGWNLELKPGWKLASGPRAGDRIVQKE
jgi:hypothetical protein